MKLYTIKTGLFKLDGGAMFGVVPKTIWNKLNAADENNLCTWAMRCLLIEDEGRLILIDTGIGDKQDAKFFSHYYLHGNDTLEKSLAKHGFKKEDISDVFLTHLHFDHCGGSVIRDNGELKPAFANAKYWSNEEHWNWAKYPNDREKASFLKENFIPLEEQNVLNFIVDEKQQEDKLSSAFFTNNISVRFVNGHTKKMMLPEIKCKNKTIVYMADLLPSIAHMPLPYVMAYDMFPLITLTEKKLFLKEAVENDYILFFEHDAINECCTLQQTEKGIKPKEIFTLEDL